MLFDSFNSHLTIIHTNICS